MLTYADKIREDLLPYQEKVKDRAGLRGDSSREQQVGGTTYVGPKQERFRNTSRRSGT